MNANFALKNEGIVIKSSLDKKNIQKISSLISKQICNAFPEHNLSQKAIFECLDSLNMFIADFSFNDSMAKYYSKTNSIYFNSKMNFECIDTLVIHECLHAIQGVKKNSGKLIKLGLFDIVHNTGEGLNEAAVQLMSAKITQTNPDSVKYYDMEFVTPSPLFYPIETALLNQLAYFTGTYPLYLSTLTGNDTFKNILIAKIGEKKYNELENNFDLLIQFETDFQIYTAEMSKLPTTGFKYQKLFNQINFCKKRILSLTFETQELIISNFFDNELCLVKDQKSIEKFNNKLLNFKDLVIGDKSYYNNFCENMLDKCITKSKIISENGSLNYIDSLQLELISLEKNMYNLSLFKRFFKKIKLLYESKIYQKE